MSEQPFPRALNPPVTIGADSYSFALEFRPRQTSQKNSRVVVSGAVTRAALARWAKRTTTKGGE